MTEDDLLNRVQDRISDVIAAIQLSDIIDGVSLRNVSLVAGQDNFVNHKLNRKLRGWIVTRVRGNSVLWDLQDDNDAPTRTLNLRCSQDVIIDLWVF